MSQGAGRLVFSRKPGQGFYIGRGIRITILDVGDDANVRVAVEAPKHVAVSRDDFTLEQHLEFQREREGQS